MTCTIYMLVALLLAGCSLTSSYTIKPTNYTLDIFINTETDVFSGTVEILADILSGGAEKFVLHNHGLNVSIVHVNQRGSEKFQSVTFNEGAETMEVHTSTGLVTSSNVKITITYDGKISTDGTGLYMFLDSDGNKIYMTNFYPIYARKFFPCIDEPGSSATIALTVTSSSNDGKFIASSAVNKSKANNGYQVYQLEPIASVSPYSLFFTMGRWDNSYKLPVPNVSLWLPQSLKSKTSLIDSNLEIAASNPNISNLMTQMNQSVLNILITPVLAGESYSGLNAVVLKNDIVINDLAETTTEDEKHHLIKISYALYKMFFGTLVQPSNWGNNWLSDSISTYLAYHALDNVDTYGSSDATLVTDFDEDVLRYSWSENSPVPYLATSPTDPAAILAFINGPAMAKGAYTIKTLETLFNKQEDRAFVISALLNFGLSNFQKSVDTDSFIKEMSGLIHVNATGISVNDILQPMISQPGYPLISLKRADLTLTLDRSNFLYTSMLALPNGGSQSTKLSSASSWLVPITLTTSKDPGDTQVSIYYYSPNKTTPISIKGVYDKNAWALLNIDGKGMIRVNYDDLTWAIFSEKLPSSFTPATRAKLVTDAFAAAESGVQSWVTTLMFLEYLDKETDLAPWAAALQGFSRMWTWIYPTGLAAKDPKQADLSTPFKAYMAKRLQNLYKNLGTSGNPGDVSDPLRRLIVKAACDYSNSSCVTDLAAQYQRMVSGSFSPSNNMFSVVACNGIKNLQTTDDWITAYQKYVNSGKWFSQKLTDSHYSILACSNLSDAINQYMKKILIRDPQQRPFPMDQVKPAIEAIMNRPEHVTDVLNFFIANQAQFNPHISLALQVEIIKALGDRLTVPSQYELLQGFSKNSSLEPALVTAVNNCIAKAQKNIDYIYSVQDSVLAGLTGDIPPTTGTSTASTTSPSIPTGTQPTGTPPFPQPTEKPDSAASLTVSMVTIALSVAILTFA